MKNDPDKFLSLIKSAHRGHHKIYLGYCAGVGKTCKMLHEAIRLRNVEKLDVVIGLLETHGRAETIACKEDLEELPRKKILYHGIEITEFDLEKALERRPQILLVDELAHTNVPGSKNSKRYQDVEELLEAGINVISTLNIQHLESLYEIIGKTTGIRVTERLPDWVLARADEVINVDLSTADLRERIRTGRIYPQNQIPAALEHFFVDGNLRQLRELTLRELASQLDLKFRSSEFSGNGKEVISPEQFLVCLSANDHNAAGLLRYASSLIGHLGINWYLLHVQTPDEANSKSASEMQKYIDKTMEMASSFGAKVFIYKSNDVANAILQFAKEHRVGQIIMGPQKKKRSWLDSLLNRPTLLEKLSMSERGFKIIITENFSEEEKNLNP